MDMAKAIRVNQALSEADLVVIGASNGFDMAEGLNIFLGDDHFWEAYGDLARLDGVGCILQGLASPNADVRERWAARFLLREHTEYEPSPLMLELLRLTGHADTFVVTCNIDGHFVKAGFNEKCVLETEGSILTSIDEQRLAHPDATALAQFDELARLMRAHRDGRVVILELGVGMRNGVIKRMLAQVADACEHVTYIVFNYSQAVAPDASCEGILVEGDIAAAFKEVAQCRA